MAEGNAIAQGFGDQRNANGQLFSTDEPQETKILVARIADFHGEIFAYAPKKPDISNTCKGDSGGPLLHRTETGKLVLIGINSSGDSHCERITDFSNPNNPANKKWIKQRMQEAETPSHFNPEDKTRLQSKVSCVKKTDTFDGIWGWMTGTKKLTFINQCAGNFKPSMKIRFFSEQTQLNIQEPEEIKSEATIKLGETKVFYTKIPSVEPVLCRSLKQW